MQSLAEWHAANGTEPSPLYHCAGVRGGGLPCTYAGPAWGFYVVSEEPPLVCCGGCVDDARHQQAIAADAAAREAAAPQVEEGLILDEINRTRDRLIEGGFSFGDDVFQSRQSDRENIAVMGQLAKLAIAGGSPEGNLRWAYPDQDFAFITATNTVVPMDAQTMSALFDRGVSFKAGLTFYARALKDAVLSAETLEEKRAIAAGAVWPLEPEAPPEPEPKPDPEEEPNPQPEPEGD